MDLVKNGALGKVRFVRTWNYDTQKREGFGNPPDADPPETLNWTCGWPGAKAPL